MQVGDRVSISAVHADSAVVSRIACTVYRMLPRFAVLDNGRYKFCAFYQDIEANKLIVT